MVGNGSTVRIGDGDAATNELGFAILMNTSL